MEKRGKVAIVGGGVAGASVALVLGALRIDVTLFEAGESLVSGPPMCHLHAGGNLYREISDEQCLRLLRESIEFVRLYPDIIDYRPTVIAVPVEDSGSPETLLPRLKLLQQEYEKLIALDPENAVLGASEAYYRLYGREDLERLRDDSDKPEPRSFDEWMVPVAKGVDLDRIQYPLVLVQEFGINMFRLGATATLGLQEMENGTLLMQTTVEHIEVEHDGSGWILSYKRNGKEKKETFDYLINAAGYRSGMIDAMLGFSIPRFVEFKAAYVTQWRENRQQWPEIVFHGERGTPRGMAQFTPYPGGYFQLHGMTKTITLFEDGLVRCDEAGKRPKLDAFFIRKLEEGWSEEEVRERTEAAIAHVARFIPAFHSAEVASKPLYGAQQIPGDDPDLRAAEVSFEGERYARCEIVKASSVLAMSDAIADRLAALGCLEREGLDRERIFNSLKGLGEAELSRHAEALCVARGYPKALASRTVERLRSV